MKNTRNYFNILDGNIIFLVFLITMGIVQAIAGSIMNAQNFGAENEFYPIVLLCTNQIAMLLAFFGYTRIKKINFVKACSFDRKISIKQIGLLVAISICSLLAFYPITRFFIYILDLIGFNVNTASTLKLPTSVGGIITFFLFTVIFAPFAEELIYRGAIAQGFKQKSYLFAIFASALLFSLAHLNATQFVYQFLVGCVIALVVLAGNSIWYGIILHIINNLIAFGIGFINIPNIHPGYIALILIVCFLVGSILLVGFLKWYFRNAKDIKNNHEDVIDVYPKGKLIFAINSTAETYVDVLRMMVNKNERARCKEEFENVMGFLDGDFYNQESVMGKYEKAPIAYWISVAVVFVMWIVTFAMGF